MIASKDIRAEAGNCGAEIAPFPEWEKDLLAPEPDHYLCNNPDCTEHYGNSATASGI